MERAWIVYDTHTVPKNEVLVCSYEAGRLAPSGKPPNRKIANTL